MIKTATQSSKRSRQLSSAGGDLPTAEKSLSLPVSSSRHRRDPRTSWPPNPPALLNVAMIAFYYWPVCTRTIDRAISDGAFPKDDATGDGVIRFWHRATVEEWTTKKGKDVA